MKKTVAACLLLTIATLANGFQSNGEWVKYTSTEGRFSVLLPQQPELSSQESTAATGEKLRQYMTEATESDSAYVLAYFDLPPDMTYSLDEGRDGFVGSAKWTLLSNEAISLGGGYPGLKFKASLKNEGGDELVSSRIYKVGSRVYMLFHFFLKASDSSTMAEKTAKFFDSFKVTPGK